MIAVAWAVQVVKHISAAQGHRWQCMLDTRGSACLHGLQAPSSNVC